MNAVLDETFPQGPKGVFYVVASAVLIADEDTSKKLLRDVVQQPNRTRPFHWNQEGPLARNKMMECLIDLGVVAHICIHYPTGRKRLDVARSRGITEIIPHLLKDGVTELRIESRGSREDARDKATILDTLNNLCYTGSLTYGWYRKEEPLLWLADALCGATREFLLSTKYADYFSELQDTGVIKQPIFINDNSI